MRLAVYVQIMACVGGAQVVGMRQSVSAQLCKPFAGRYNWSQHRGFIHKTCMYVEGARGTTKHRCFDSRAFDPPSSSCIFHFLHSIATLTTTDELRRLTAQVSYHGPDRDNVPPEGRRAANSSSIRSTAPPACIFVVGQWKPHLIDFRALP
uniref:Secreted protein n=1 Tax=Panagrellus redivivus TaxID=6233 RepID=A0A7E4VK75_PANRE